MSTTRLQEHNKTRESELLSFGEFNNDSLIPLFVTLFIYLIMRTRSRWVKGWHDMCNSTKQSNCTVICQNLPCGSFVKIKSQSQYATSADNEPVPSHVEECLPQRCTSASSQSSYPQMLEGFPSNCCCVSRYGDVSTDFEVDGDATPVNTPALKSDEICSYHLSVQRVGHVSLLYNSPISEVSPTLDELAIKMVHEEKLNQALQIPFGWQRMQKLSDITADIVEDSGFSDIKLTYRSILSKLCVGADALVELPLPTSNDTICTTKYAISFMRAFSPQLSAMSQALLDVVNGVDDIKQSLNLIWEYGTKLEMRLSPYKLRPHLPRDSKDMLLRKYEALLRFYQLFNEYRFSGRKRRQSVILACFKEKLLHSYNFLKPLTYIDGNGRLQKLLLSGKSVRKAARIYYKESQSICQKWNEIRQIKSGWFYGGLSEKQADNITECANRLCKLCHQVNEFQQVMLRRYCHGAEAEFLRLLLYIDRNRLCIRLSRRINYNDILVETCELLRTVRGEPHVDQMLEWLES